ncbi:MAG TPA: SDR family oxidoreductase [Pirellulales bacterium]|jgi:NAD(P)-dependent dehydrogenase (short-subunit alcohol dehydrogenase family)|nr:SDR family oxidoreductase [Pirellulales bacterium]
MSEKLAGKVAVITGGNSGIGLATAQRFVNEGAFVFVVGRRQSELDAAAKQIGRNVMPLQGDVAKLADLDRLYAEVKRHKGHIDILFANAGVLDYAPLGSITEEHYDKLFDINVKGLLFSVQKALPLLKDGGSIILTASVVASKAFEASSVYSATKAAVRSFARGWAIDLKARKIRVNALSPGPIDTPMGASIPADLKQQFEAGIPLGRFGTSAEMAGAALFLASDDSSYVTGSELLADGGVGQV